jgi:hypothetical protein
LAGSLSASEVPVWCDSGIEPGERFGQEIQQAIDECAGFVVVLTPASVASTWVRREISYADERGKRLLPLLVERCTAPVELAGTHREAVTHRGMPTPGFLAQLRKLAHGTGLRRTTGTAAPLAAGVTDLLRAATVDLDESGPGGAGGCGFRIAPGLAVTWAGPDLSFVPVAGRP